MVAITDVLDSVAREARIGTPASWLTDEDEDYELIAKNFLREVAEELLARLDLPQPISQQTVITGDGTEDYDLPTNFLRLQRDATAVYETTTTRRAGVPISDDGVWTHIKQVGTAGGARFYRIRGYDGAFEIDFYDTPGSNVSITVHYVSKNWMVSSGGTYGSEFTDPDDILLIPRRPVELGILWRYRRDKGLFYDDIKSEFEAYVTRLINDSRQIKSISFANDPTPDAKVMRVPVPDYIPDT